VPAPPPPPAYKVGPQNERLDEETIYVDEERPIALTWNPLGILWGRLSVNFEFLLAEHHALTLSASTLVFDDGRGDAKSLLSEGFGFASPVSAEIGGEVGYHYWFTRTHTLRGPYVGPSFLFGLTNGATIGDPTVTHGYWGFALDAGWQQVFDGGFTVGAGVGVEVLRMGTTSAVVPRILAQLGYSF
jgi:hypothetical protein